MSITVLIAFCAQYLFILAPVLVAVVFRKTAPVYRRLMLWRRLVVLIVSFILAKIGGAIYDEPRPFVLSHKPPLVPHVADNSFPSDHVLLILASAFLLISFSWRGAALLLLVGVIVGFARVAGGLHSPTDIAASAFFAVLANRIAYVAVPCIRRLPPGGGL